MNGSIKMNVRISTIKKALIYAAVFAVTVALLTGLLVLSALIPGETLRDNMLSSADTLCENEVFFKIWKDVPASHVDRYADSILLNIACHWDSSEPLRSVMLSEFYSTDQLNENDNFRNALLGELPANTQYLRYWHGSAVLVRLAHTFTDIRGMYIMNAGVMIILTALLVFMLIRRRLYAGAVGTAAALIAAGIWIVPFSLEYTWVFIIALAFSAAAVKLSDRENPLLLSVMFLLSGIVTNYLDFLTAETLTLTMPLLLALYIRRESPSCSNAVFALKNTLLWGAGYAGMWVTKWLLAAAVLGEDTMPYVSEHIAERIGSEPLEEITEALAGNISCLFPVGYGGIGIIAAVLLILAAAYICFVYRKPGINGRQILIYAAVGAVPFVRYIILHEHSALHYFFTYRALAGTVLAVCLMIYAVVGGRTNGTAKR